MSPKKIRPFKEQHKKSIIKKIDSFIEYLNKIKVAIIKEDLKYDQYHTTNSAATHLDVEVWKYLKK